jgi:hypothetical protein
MSQFLSIQLLIERLAELHHEMLLEVNPPVGLLENLSYTTEKGAY